MLPPGQEASIDESVTEAMTAAALGSGDVPVLGTPAVLALAERAACAAIAGHLGPGETTVGSTAEIEHLAPTPVGVAVSASARLVEVNGRTLRFEIEVSDPAGPVARVRHERVVVDRERFIQRAGERSPD